MVLNECFTCLLSSKHALARYCYFSSFHMRKTNRLNRFCKFMELIMANHVLKSERVVQKPALWAVMYAVVCPCPYLGSSIICRSLSTIKASGINLLGELCTFMTALFVLCPHHSDPWYKLQYIIECYIYVCMCVYIYIYIYENFNFLMKPTWVNES